MVPGFVDESQLHAKAGNGGAGAVSFRREAHVDRGGPDGGDGGRGGHVWLEPSQRLASLLAFSERPHRGAEKGGHGSGKRRHGADGRDLTVEVPVGTVVRSLDGELLADLSAPGQRWRAAEGGRGGRGNARFLSNRRRAPSFAEQGELGEERWLNLELKLMADVALVGFPNAGKSTLISAISAAKPRIAAYPFTTLEPHLGVVRDDDMEMVVADIPGLIEGASKGKGLGHQFLRHVERARALVILADLAPDDDRSPPEQERILLDELGRYQPELLARPRIVVGSKSDVAIHDFKGMRISAATGTGLPDLLGQLKTLVSHARQQPDAGDPVEVLHRPRPQGFEIQRASDGAFVVKGRQAERAVALSDLTDNQAVEYIQVRLNRLGVVRALTRAGARDGDLVHIGNFTFTFEPD